MSADHPPRDPHGLRRRAGARWQEVERLDFLERYLRGQLAEVRRQRKELAETAIETMGVAALADRAELFAAADGVRTRKIARKG